MLFIVSILITVSGYMWVQWHSEEKWEAVWTIQTCSVSQRESPETEIAVVGTGSLAPEDNSGRPRQAQGSSSNPQCFLPDNAPSLYAFKMGLGTSQGPSILQMKPPLEWTSFLHKDHHSQSNSDRLPKNVHEQSILTFIVFQIKCSFN